MGFRTDVLTRKRTFSDERAVLHALLIDNITTDGKLAYDAGTPLPELRGADGIDTITYRNDGIKVVESVCLE